MKKRLILFISLLIAVFLVSCSAPEVPTTKDTTDAVDVSEPPTVQESEEDDSGITVRQSEGDITEPEIGLIMSDEVRELLELSEKIESAEFTKDSGTTNAQLLAVKGSKYTKKVKLPTSYTDPSENYDTVYIDRAEKIAYGYCADESKVKCPEEYRDQAYILNFEEEDVTLPFDLIEDVAYAEKKGTITMDSRQIKLIEFTNDQGYTEKLGLDDYFGFVYLQEIHDEDKLIEKHTFTDVIFNKLKDEDVSLPQGVEIIQTEG